MTTSTFAYKCMRCEAGWALEEGANTCPKCGAVGLERQRHGWISFADPAEVVPIDDLKTHFGEACWCEPFERDGVLIHNSADQREAFENGERLPS